MSTAASLHMLTPLHVVILGRQGSGKGTQSALLVEAYGWVHVSTGDMLRAAVEARTELGCRAEAVMKAGELVGDDIMVGIVADRLGQEDVSACGVLLDGFPRTVDQAEALEAILTDLDRGLDVAVNMEVPVNVVTERMLMRGRSDDTDEAIAQRLSIYEDQTAPLLGWFSNRDLLVTVDGLGTVDEVFRRIATAVDGRRQQRI